MIGILILAGGRGRRMGGQDKGWINYRQRPMVFSTLESIQRQLHDLGLKEGVDVEIVISANRNIDRYQELGYQVVQDVRQDYPGPLAGIESATVNRKLGHIKRWVVCPVDSPNLPAQFLSSMIFVDKNSVAYLKQGQKCHYAHLTFSRHHQKELSWYLDRGGRSIKDWLSITAKTVVIKVNRFEDEMINVNTVQTENVKLA